MTVAELLNRLSDAPKKGKILCFVGEQLVPISGAFTANGDILMSLDVSDEDLYDAARTNFFSKQDP
jgi:hypothetical protein